jgi:hypothetical protein
MFSQKSPYSFVIPGADLGCAICHHLRQIHLWDPSTILSHHRIFREGNNSGNEINEIKKWGFWGFIVAFALSVVKFLWDFTIFCAGCARRQNFTKAQFLSWNSKACELKIFLCGRKRTYCIKYLLRQNIISLSESPAKFGKFHAYLLKGLSHEIDFSRFMDKNKQLTLLS